MFFLKGDGKSKKAKTLVEEKSPEFSKAPVEREKHECEERQGNIEH